MFTQTESRKAEQNRSVERDGREMRDNRVYRDERSWTKILSSTSDTTKFLICFEQLQTF